MAKGVGKNLIDCGKIKQHHLAELPAMTDLQGALRRT